MQPSDMEEASTERRVVTLTPAPAIDRVYRCDALRTGSVNRIVFSRAYLAGKGVNIAHNLRLVTPHITAVVPLGLIAEVVADEDADLGLDADFLAVCPVKRPLRRNTIIVGRDGHTTNLNEEPAALDPSEWDDVVQTTLDSIKRVRADWLVVAGALPRSATTGDPLDLTPLLTLTHDAGVRIAIDLSGDALRTYASSPYVSLVKPNLPELQEIVHHPLHTFSDAIAAARHVMSPHNDPVFVVSLGEEGVLAVTASEVSWAPAAQTTVINTTGAGDAALAGFLATYDVEGRDRSHALDQATSAASVWGALAVARTTTRLTTLANAPTAPATVVDMARPLHAALSQPDPIPAGAFA